jgi:orotate phosphoribosyltransferase
MDPLGIFKKVGAIITDTHVVYASGRHGSAYVNKDAVYPHTKEISGLCRDLAARFKGRGVEIAAGPTVGGVILAQWTAHFLSELDGRDVLAVFAEEETTPGGERRRFFKRGYDKLIAGKNVLVVEDILTTGGSAKKVVEAVKALGGRPVACGALVNRGDIKEADIGAPLTALVNITLDAWDEKDCPLCKKGVPVDTNVGKGREWLKKVKAQN